ncbi:MAG: carboxypeptidase-like regulatory domain-containing protein, partial [Terriglobia bacterium]
MGYLEGRKKEWGTAGSHGTVWVPWAFLAVLAGLLMICGLGVAPAKAQTGTAQLSGTVHDPSGAAIPGASVTITQTETGMVRKAVTSGTGSYYLGGLPRGPYRLVVQKNGFKQWIGSLLLVVGQNATSNATLTVGQVTQQI